MSDDDENVIRFPVERRRVERDKPTMRELAPGFFELVNPGIERGVTFSVACAGGSHIYVGRSSVCACGTYSRPVA